MSAYDEYDPDFIRTTKPAKNRKQTRPKRRRFDDEPLRRGRLTEEERERLAALRDEPEPRPLPNDADRWSTWDSGERGPRPHPPWLVTELAAVDHELGVLKTGKEADVHVLRRSVPGGDSCLLAAKRYRDLDHRMFHRDAGYLEGRRMRKSREMRAMRQRSSFGRGVIAEQWAVAEFAVLSSLWAAGAPVPYPVQRIGTEVLLEFLGAADGTAAPRLAALRPTPDELDDLWLQLVNALVALAGQGFTHGDLSAYNVLVHDGRLLLIDLPQAVDLVANPRGLAYLRRDAANITGWFRARGADEHRTDPDELAVLLATAANLM
ncbi:serine protein kinase RIO [Saccharopolyspora phatthalungensis]|uniref:non-specific serine/threonine protein kinase n=1 Tax=Saccharopolyspora phatthalungensis TaxID=664693 RepID=A0A840PZC5_9PSEU|nr:RIO1 family regulatory kinase/ATPase [Saccharopolyspora phatthalungensis]MBB5155632.1 RIO kinase 1 [Saccharopolyspora phatthalungensis]